MTAAGGTYPRPLLAHKPRRIEKNRILCYNNQMNMPEKTKNTMLKSLFHAAKGPLIYFVSGLALMAISYINTLVPFTTWKPLTYLSYISGLTLTLLAGIVFIYNFFALGLKQLEEHLQTNNPGLTLIIAGLRKGLKIIFILISLKLIISLIGPPEPYLQYINTSISVIIIAAIAWLAIHSLLTIETFLFQNMASQKDNERAKAIYTKMHIIRNILTVIIILIAVAFILLSFSSVRNIGISLLASAGFLTAMIGLSAQKTLYSLFSGVQIAFAQPIKIGDVVLLDKESGVIEEITFTYVTIKLGDMRRLIVPISAFIEKPFENWSHEGNSIRSSFIINVDYHMPIDKLREEFERITHASCYWDGRAKKMQVANINDTSIEIRMQVSAKNTDDLSDLRAEIREKLLHYMQTNYPQHFPKNNH